MGYHINVIPKGVLGEWSKVEEEWAEYLDAKEQGSSVMMMVELCDVYGAIREFYNKYGINGDAIIVSRNELDKVKTLAEELGLTMEDIRIFSDITKRAFLEGERV